MRHLIARTSGTLLILFSFSLLFSNANAQINQFEMKVGVMADYKTWQEAGQTMTADEIRDAMELMAGAFETIFFDTEWANENNLTIVVPEAYRFIIMEETTFSGSTACDWSPQVDGLFNSYANSPQCVDAILFLSYSSAVTNAHCNTRKFGDESGTPILFANWIPNSTQSSIFSAMAVAHEMTHAFNGIHVDGIGGNSCGTHCGLSQDNLPPIDYNLLTESAVENNKVSYLMCKAACEGYSYISTALMDSFNLGRITSRIEDNPDLFAPEQSPCQHCRAMASVQTTIADPANFSCGENTSFKLNAVFQNDCDFAKTVNLELTILNMEVENFITPDEPGWSFSTSNGHSFFSKSNVTLAQQEKLEVTFTAMITEEVNAELIELKVEMINASNLAFEGYNSSVISSPNLEIRPRFSESIGADGQTVLLSDLISEGKILPTSQSPINTQDLSLEGTLIIDQNYTFGAAMEEESHISVDVYSKIVVQNGKSLTLNSVLLDNCQEGMWEGIKVENGGLLQVKNSRIYHAQTGIEAEPLWSYVEISNTEFFNNHIAVNIKGHAPGIYSDLGLFYGNWIHADDNLLWPYAGQKAEAGLIVNDNPSIVIGAPYIGITDTPIFGAIGTTRFEGLKNAIQIRNGDAQIDNCKFSEIDNIAIDHRGGLLVMENFSGTTALTFDKVGTAIKGNETTLTLHGHLFKDIGTGINMRESPYGKTSITNNRFLNFENKAIAMWQVDEFDILQNEVRSGVDTKLNASGISINNILSSDADKLLCENTIIMEEGSRGLYLYNTHSTKISKNLIQMGSNARSGAYLGGCDNLEVNDNVISKIGTSSFTGQALSVNGSFGSAYQCNSMSGFETAASFFGICDDSDFKGSTIFNSTRGLTIGIYPNIGGSLMGIQNHKGNEWSGSFSDVGGYFAGALIQSNLSQFTVDETTPNYLPTTNISGWFIDEDDMDLTYRCPELPGDISDLSCTTLEGLIDHGGAEIYDDILVSGAPVPGFGNPTPTWVAHRHLLKRIDKGLTNLSASQISAYITSSNSQTYGALHSVSQMALDYHKDGNYINNQTQIEAGQAQLKAHLQSLIALQKDRLDGVVSQSNFTQNRTTLKNSMTVLKDNLTLWQNDNAAIKSSYQTQAQSLNAAIITSLLPAQNEKDLNGLYFTGIDASQLAAIQTIAEQCPLDGGDAVYAARAILNDWEVVYNDDEALLCANSLNRQPAASESAKETLTLYPNPANETININGNLSQGNTLQIYDGRGSIIQTLDLEKGRIRVNLSVKDWPSGVYYYGLNGKEVNKLIIIH